MDTPAIIVTVAGLLLAGFVLWYFLLSGPPVADAATVAGGVQEVTITVKGGYSPALIEVTHGRPVRLRFFRDEENSCSEELLLPDFNIRRDLPAFQTTLVELLPTRPGRFDFTCGMGMLRGTLLVK